MNKRIAIPAAALLGCLAAAIATPARADDVPHLCGGIGVEGRQELRAHVHDYNLGLSLAQGSQRVYLSEVTIKVQQGDKTLTSFTADGPICYLKLPAGKYTIVGTHAGVDRSMTIETGRMDAQLRW